MRTQRLERPVDGRVLAGVCQGFAEHTGIDVRWVRIAFAVLTFAGGIGAFFYAWFWVTVPVHESDDPLVPLKAALTKPSSERPAAPRVPDGSDRVRPAQYRDAQTAPARNGVREQPRGPAAPQRGRGRAVPVTELILGALLLVAGIALVLPAFGIGIPLETVLPTLAVVGGIGLTWWQVADRSGSGRTQIVRTIAAIALVAVGALMFFLTSRAPSAWTVIAAALSVLAGVALALAPWLLRINRELIAERTARARESERGEIAAHLHDSVLQTLAMIQQQSDPTSEAARLARSQERELREWLFQGQRTSRTSESDAGDAPPEHLLAAHAGELETQYAVRFELVPVGEPVPAPEPIMAAAREAMLNAARHAGGDVTVYIEHRPERTDIDVTDRGPGFDLSALPTDRMGVTGSIIGRMERAGGTARIVPGPGGAGTSVRLSISRGEPDAEEAER